MRVLDLFSGIGGFSLGLQMAGGFETVQFVEIDPWCRQVLAKNFPGVPVHDDIKTFGGVPADVVCGGFPCQPFSHAGKQRGTADDRDLWPEMARVIETVRPAWVIGENVAGFIPMGLDRSISDLESLGYEVQAFDLPACAVQAPHRRSRVWIIGHSHRHDEPELPVDAEVSRQPTLAHSISQRGCSGHPAGENAEDAGESPRGQELRQWLPEPSVGRVAHGIPRRVDRLRGLGNAVVPQVVAEIGRAIMSSRSARQ